MMESPREAKIVSNEKYPIAFISSRIGACSVARLRPNMNYLFTPENNKLFAEEDHITPNTADAFDQIKEKFDVSEDHISQLGSVTFNYSFYDNINDTLTEISKANNPKYMIDNGDGTYAMYPLDYYMENLENRLTSN